MSRLGFVVVLVAWPALALAQPALDIVSPGAGSCVNNGPEVFIGGGFFGQALPPERAVPVELRLAEPAGQEISLSFEVEGRSVLDAVFQPQAANAPELTGDRFSLPSFELLDGIDREIRVVARSAGGETVRTVRFTLDRQPPLPVVNGENFPDLEQCYAAPPPVEYQVSDNLDPMPTAVERFENNGCQQDRIVRLSDACGNVQDIRLTTNRQPVPADVQLTLTGYRCGLESCITDGPDAESFQNGDRVGAGTVEITVGGGAGCVGGLVSRFFVNEAPPAVLGEGDGEILVPGQEFREAGNYTVVVEAQACGQRVLRRELAFTVLDRPTADAGGPYQVVQGGMLTLDGSGSTAPAELGGIVEYAWDVNGDGLFDFEGPEFVQVPFDSNVNNGVYECLLRITAGNGGVDFDVFEVTVGDVTPTCDAGGPYRAVEGQGVELDGSGSAPGDPSEPIIAYAWDFGDNLFPQRGFGLDHPSHVFEDSGRYTVTLVVEDEDSESAPCEAEVIVDDVQPVVEGLIAFRANALTEGDEVFFSAGDTRPGSGSDPISSFCWIFDADAANPGPPECGPALRGPSHVYDDDGPRRVCLQVRDEEPDDFAEACLNIVLADLQPRAALRAPAFATEGDVLTLDATGSAAGGDADPLTRLEFLLVDPLDPENPRPLAEINAVAEPGRFRIDVPFADNGDFLVRLRVHDEDSFAEAEVPIRVADVAPRAELTAVYPDEERVAREGRDLLLDASGSTPGDESDPIVAYRWEFGDGVREETNTPTVRHAWPDAGVYPVRVVVVDEDGSQSAADLQVRVVNVAPLVFIEAEVQELEVGVEAEFRLTVEDVDADRPPPSIIWEMGDGTRYENRQIVRHTFNDAGDYTVEVRVDHPGEDSEAGSATLDVSVTAAAPRFQLAEPRQPLDQVIRGREGEPMRIRLQVDSAPLGEGRFDGEVLLAVSVAPEGATSRLTDDGNAEERQYVQIDWTPTFYQAGTHDVTIQALAPVSGVQRQIRLRLEVDEAGSPLLAAIGGAGTAGEATLYRYGLENGEVTFVRIATVPVGLGATGLAHDPRNGRRLFVATPGSGGVAVVGTTGQPRLLRTVPTGAGTRAVVWGDGRVWALNGTDNTIAIIDPDTLKVDRVVDLMSLDRPLDLAWLPAGLGGLDADHLAVVTARGDVALYDAGDLGSGRAGLTARARIGGVLDRVVADASTGWLAISDRKTRSVYRIAVEELLANPDGPDMEGTSVLFAARDLASRDGIIYAATDAGVWQLAPDGVTQPADRTLATTAVAELPIELLTGGGVIIGEAERVFNYTGDLQRLVGAPGGRMRRLTAFVALDE
ncbi:MAG: PKD domain-containing protein [Myxococcales bacterium]|nr:PKD domain-containing protein [Myxococcales bacterium]